MNQVAAADLVGVADQVEATRCPALGDVRGVHPESSGVQSQPARWGDAGRAHSPAVRPRAARAHMRASLPANRLATDPGARQSQWTVGTTALPTMPGWRGSEASPRGGRSSPRTGVEPAPHSVEPGLVLEVHRCEDEAAEDHAGVHDAVHVCARRREGGSCCARAGQGVQGSHGGRAGSSRSRSIGRGGSCRSGGRHLHRQ